MALPAVQRTDQFLLHSVPKQKQKGCPASLQRGPGAGPQPPPQGRELPAPRSPAAFSGSSPRFGSRYRQICRPPYHLLFLK